MKKRLKLSFYVIEEALEPVKHALFAAGAGRYDGFSECAWQTLGDGQYKAGGDDLVRGREYKVEIYLESTVWPAVKEALFDAHPCDQPAYDLLEMIPG